MKQNLSVDESNGGIFVVYKKIETGAFQPNFSIGDLTKLFFTASAALLLPRPLSKTAIQRINHQSNHFRETKRVAFPIRQKFLKHYYPPKQLNTISANIMIVLSSVRQIHYGW